MPGRIFDLQAGIYSISYDSEEAVTCHVGVAPVRVDRMAQVALLAIDLLSSLLRQLAAVGRMKHLY